MSPRAAGALAILVSIALSVGPGCPLAQSAEAPHASELTFASSMYVGWMPWHLAAEDGTLKRYSEDGGLRIRFESGDYLATLNRFARGEIDAVTTTNIEKNCCQPMSSLMTPMKL